MLILVTATTTATSTTAAAAAIATTVTAAEIAGREGALFTRFEGTGFVDSEGATFVGGSVETADSCLCFVFGAHFDKTETAGATGNFVVNELNARNIADLGKKIRKFFFGSVVRQVADVEFNAHDLI